MSRRLKMLRMAFIIVVGAVFSPAAANAHSISEPTPWDMPTLWPDRIIASPGADPATSFSVNWRTDARVSSAIAEIAKATGDSRFDLLANPVASTWERIDLEKARHAHGYDGTPNHGRGVIHAHSVTFKGLEPDTLYAWRVRGAEGKWSEWYQTRTAPTEGPLTFLYYGDAQYGVRSHASRVFRQGLLSAPDARFVIHAGDLVNKGDRDTEWAEWFEAGGFIHAMIPVIPVAGNHEYLSTPEGGSKDGKAVLTELWRPHFTLPVEEGLPEALHETVYDIKYGDDLHVFVLDSSSPDWSTQMRWLTRKADASTARWKVVSLHHSPFRPGIQGYKNAPERGKYHRARQAAFIKATDRAGIDMVLAGHNHSYTRASIGDNVGPGIPEETSAARLAEPRPVDMVVIVAISGAMSGTMTSERFSRGNAVFGDGIALERWANNTPTYQTITIDGETLSFTAYTAVGEAYDAFTLSKAAGGAKTITNEAPAFGPVRRFETTGPYKDRNSLK